MDELDAGYLDQLAAAPVGDHQAGEIEIITDRDVLNTEFRAWAEANGRAQPYIGIVYEDDYIAVVRDAVRFPKGNVGDYIRVVQKPLTSWLDGVVIVPLHDGATCFRRTFRHATRRWGLELPRGGIAPGETPDAAAKRELRQETGLIADHVRSLGTLAADTGLIGSTLRVFLAVVDPREARPPTPEVSEAFDKMSWLTPEAFLAELRAGELQDAISIAALEMARADGAWGKQER